MKKYIHANSTDDVRHIEVVVEILLDGPEGQVAAAKKVTDLPKGDLLPAEKDALIDSQALEDYHAFIDSIEDLITDYYGLHVFYKNDSPDNSFYFGMLAKDDNDNLILDFDFILRISTHPAHRSAESQQHKKEKSAALLEITKGKATKPLRKSILVNKDEFGSYDEAYVYVDKEIESAVAIMKRKLH